MRINIIGGSGAGATTLGKMLAEHFDIPHLDADDFFHLPSDPPYLAQREPADRDAMLTAALGPNFVLSGGTMGWQVDLTLTHLIWLCPPHDVRMERLCAREAARPAHPGQADFIEWARQYEAGTREGKSAARHSGWFEAQTCAKLKSRNPGSLEDEFGALVAWLGTDGFKGAPTFDD